MSCIGPRNPYNGLHGAMLVASLLVWGLAAGCAKEDTGQCCTVFAGSDPDLIPKPEFNGADPISVVRVHPDFDCENLTCVSFKGSQAFCTKECAFDDGCPEGFTCQPVIESNPGPMSNLGPDDKFCVRTQTECTQE